MAPDEAAAPSLATKPLAPSRRESASVFVLAAGFVALVGALAVTQNAVSWGALAAVSHAVDVLRQEDTVNLALIGFVEPPLPSLLHLPLAWLAPGMASNGQTVWMFGAIVAGLTLLTLNAACADLGLGRAGRWLFCALVLVNPVFLGLMATGAPDGLYLFLLLGAGWALLRWQRREALRDLISCSLFLSLAVLTRYDAVVPVLAATLVVAVQTLRTGARWSKLEGTLITFLLPIAYVAGLWVLANWVILADPWHFWREAWRLEPGARATVAPWQSLLGSCAAFVPLLPAIWWAIWGGAGGRPRLALGPALVLLSPALGVLLAPGCFRGWLAHASETGLPLFAVPELLPAMLAAGMLLAACALGDLGPLFRRKSYTKEICLAGTAALVAASCLLVLGEDERVYLDPRPALYGAPLGVDDASLTRTVAARLQAEEPRGTLVVAGWPGYAVTLYAERLKHKTLLVRPEPPAEPLKGPPVAALLIRNGADLATYQRVHRRWERALGTQLPAKPKWVLDGWAYWPAALQ